MTIKQLCTIMGISEYMVHWNLNVCDVRRACREATAEPSGPFSAI